MKKAYEAPTVEKIAFNYRDQVVAASAGGTSGMSGANDGYGIDDFINDAVKYLLNEFGVCHRIPGLNG